MRRCRTKNGCLSRSMTINTYNKIEAESLDCQCVTLYVPLTPESKDSINEESLMEMRSRRCRREPHWSTLRAQRGCTRREIHEVLCARTAFCYLSDVPARDNTDLKTCEEQSVVIMNTPDQNVNDVAELVFDMMMNGRAWGDWQEQCDSTLNMITGASQSDTAHIMVPAEMTPRAKGHDSSAGRRSEEV